MTDAALGVTCDVADHGQLRALVDATVAWAGGIDVVVNNAGVSLVNSMFQDEAEFEDNWARTLDVNLTAHARLIRLAVPHLIESGAGRIVNIASTESIVATAGLAPTPRRRPASPGSPGRSPSNSAATAITVNCICPGPIDTGMTASIPAEAKETYARRRVPLRRYGNPEEVAHMTLNLCLPSSSFVNGATIPVDGGMTIRHT